MMRPIRLQHQFVDTIPDVLEPGVLYVSMRFRTAVHLCPTGCGEEVVTPLDRDDWILTFDGAVTLRPSVGNWGLACRSHYWITRDEVVWARIWSREEVTRARDVRIAPDETPRVGWLARLLGAVRRKPPSASGRTTRR
jgi:hypothetical protein